MPPVAGFLAAVLVPVLRILAQGDEPALDTKQLQPLLPNGVLRGCVGELALHIHELLQLVELVAHALCGRTVHSGVLKVTRCRQ